MSDNNLQSFADEAKFLNQTENHCVFYIPGRGIVQDANGKYLFFPLGELTRYEQNEMIDPSLLSDVSILQDHEFAQITKLVELDTQLSPLGLHPVRLHTNDETDYLIFAHENCEDSFYQVALDEIGSLNQAVATELRAYTEERDLENPYCVQFEGDNSIVVY